MIIAITGATGFVGGRLIDALTSRNIAIRALTRRPQAPRDGVTWIAGALNDPDSLSQLVEGTSAVIHVAGAVNAPSRHAFAVANAGGTAAIITAAQAAGIRRFIHVSSLAAKHPTLSLYGASKAWAEDIVKASGLDWTMVRPPAVYGPGDHELLEMFRMAKLGAIFLPPAGRLSLIHTDDLARLLANLATSVSVPPVTEPDDGRLNGWSHKEFAAALATAVGRRALALHTPKPLLKAGAMLDRLVRGKGAKLTQDRVAYFCHPDWVTDPALKPSPEVWTPQIPTPDGLAQTAQWYHKQRWL